MKRDKRDRRNVLKRPICWIKGHKWRGWWADPEKYYCERCGQDKMNQRR